MGLGSLLICRYGGPPIANQGSRVALDRGIAGAKFELLIARHPDRPGRDQGRLGRGSGRLSNRAEDLDASVRRTELQPVVTLKKRRALEPISHDEFMSNASMSGFVAFREHPSPIPLLSPPAETGGLVGAASATAAFSQLYAVKSPSLRGIRYGRIRKATMVEDGHSLAEQAVYEVLWQTATAVDELADGDRMIRIGYQRLAQMARLSWVSVKANLRTLEKKLAIEVIGSENSATREGKCYLVYSRSAILERRKRAGLEWVRRTRGVELMTQATANLERLGS
jgi:hypothetical protein